MIFSYRTRRFLRRAFGILTNAVIFGVILLLVGLLWLQRFVVYTPEGARFDFALEKDPDVGVQAGKPKPGPSVNLEFLEPPADDKPADIGLQQINGYYVTVDELLDDLGAVEEKILALPEGTPVLLDVKGIWGYFYYSTAVGKTTSSSFDMAVMDRFFAAVNSQGLYTIARLPAFRDYDFGRNNHSCALASPGGYLFADADYCYWLKPHNDRVLTYLIQITRELQKMGFDEVVFKDFRFPDSENIVFDGDRGEAIAKAAQTLVTACAGDGFAVSFISADPEFVLPEGQCRLYLENVPASEVQQVLSRYENGDKRILFLAQTNDTRYDAGCVLRPIDLAR